MDKFRPIDKEVFDSSEYIFGAGKMLMVPVGSPYSPKDSYMDTIPVTLEEMSVEVVSNGVSTHKYKRFKSTRYISYLDENDEERFLLATNDLWHRNNTFYRHRDSYRLA